MARIRTIKPEFCTSDQLAECSTSARLLFVLMWLFCDDAGRHQASTKRLKMECFPADELTDVQMQSLVNELINADLIFEYEYRAQRLWQVKSWKKHQKIDRPSYKFGPLDKGGEPIYFDQNSLNDRRQFNEDSTSPRDGMEPNGCSSFRNGMDNSAAASAAAANFEKLDQEKATEAATKLAKAIQDAKLPLLPKLYIWQVACVSELLAPGFCWGIAAKIRAGDVRNCKSYIDGAMRGECTRVGLDWRSVREQAPKPVAEHA